MAEGLGGHAAPVRVTGPVPLLNSVGHGVMASVHGGVVARARRRQRARSVPSGSRRGWQRTPGSGRPRGDLRWLGRRRTAPSALRLSSDGRKAAAGVGHGAAHLLLLVADARNLPGARAVQRTRGRGQETRQCRALARSTTDTEENDSDSDTVN